MFHYSGIFLAKCGCQDHSDLSGQIYFGHYWPDIDYWMDTNYDL